MLLFVDLDYTDHWLSVNLRVVVDDDIETLVNCDEPRCYQSLHLRQFRLLKLNIVGSRDSSLLLIALTVLFKGHFVDISERMVAASLLYR